jgi:hypothetical protein
MLMLSARRSSADQSSRTTAAAGAAFDVLGAFDMLGASDAAPGSGGFTPGR